MRSHLRCIAWVWIVCLTTPALSHAQPALEKPVSLPYQEPLKSISFNRSAEPKLFLLGARDLYAADLSTQNRQHIFHIRGSGQLRDIHTADETYLLSSDGVYKQNSVDERWQRIFSSPITESNDTLCLLKRSGHDNALYLGTKRGIYFSDDGGTRWKYLKNKLAHKSIWLLQGHPEMDNILYAATVSALWISHDFGEHFEKSLEIKQNYAPALDEEPETPLSDNVSGQILAIEFDAKDGKLWVISPDQVFRSYDTGTRWEAVSLAGLPKPKIRDLLVTPEGRVLIASQNQVYYLSPETDHWRPLQDRHFDQEILKLELGQSTPETLFVMGQDRVFQIPPQPPEAPLIEGNTDRRPSPEAMRKLHEIVRQEPTIQELHKAAIRFNDVSNGKLKRWHWGSRAKALIPSLSVNKQTSGSNNIDLDRGSTSASDVYITGPDSYSLDVDMELEWQLGDLIWNSAQTSIDVRSRLMVELRDELLNEVTRLYFERRKLVMQVILFAPQEPREHLEALLRVDELSGYLDALTGGHFSEHLQKQAEYYASLGGWLPET